MDYVELAGHWMLAGILGWSAAGKARTPSPAQDLVADVLRLVRLSLPASVRSLLLWSLIVVEFATAVTLVTGIESLARPGLVTASVLLTGFAGLSVATVARGLELRCACFGTGQMRLGWRHVGRNLGLLAVSTVELTVGRFRPASELDLAGLLIGGIAALVAVLMVTRLDDIALLFGARDGGALGPHRPA